MRGKFAFALEWVEWHTLPSSVACGDSFPEEKPRLSKKVAPLSPCGARIRRWGEELYGCPKYFGLWLPLPSSEEVFDTLSFPRGGAFSCIMSVTALQ